MITLDMSHKRLHPRNVAWLREIPSEHVCSLPIIGEWRCYMQDSKIVYYKGDLAKAARYDLHLLSTPGCVRGATRWSAFCLIRDSEGRPLMPNTLHFEDVRDQHELKTRIAAMPPLENVEWP